MARESNRKRSTKSLSRSTQPKNLEKAPEWALASAMASSSSTAARCGQLAKRHRDVVFCSTAYHRFTGQSSAGQEPRHPIKSYFNGQDLIVDDEPAIRYIVAKGLLNDFDAVDQAANGEVALDMIRGSNYDCILLDLKMPGINGQEVYERVARYDRRITDRIFVMTGDTASPETASFLSRVGNTVIHKPFTLDGLRKNLRDGLLTGSSTPK